jgi:hypothetical protein
MTMRIALAAVILALSALSLTSASAQPAAGGPEALIQWSFDDGAGGWQALDPAAQVTVTHDAALARPDGGGALQCTYTTAAGQFAAVMAPVDVDLSAAKSLHFWIRTSKVAMLFAFVTERDGSRYNLPFTSLSDRWQEASLGLDELRLADDSSDENGRLDPGEIGAVAIADISSFLADAAKQVPFIMAPDLGPTTLFLDDVSITAKPVEPRWKEITVGGQPALRLDGFERAPLEWFVLAGKGVEVEYDQEYKTEGDYALRLQYDLPAGKIFGALTPLPSAAIAGAKQLSLSLMSEVATTLLVELKERDDSKYQTMVPLPADGKLQPYAIPLSSMKLADDSTDENGRIDPDQLKELTLGDLSALAGGQPQVSTLWLDDVVFVK